MIHDVTHLLLFVCSTQFLFRQLKVSFQGYTHITLPKMSFCTFDYRLTRKSVKLSCFT